LEGEYEKGVQLSRFPVSYNQSSDEASAMRAIQYPQIQFLHMTIITIPNHTK
jgi:hypothetical protein